MIELNCFFLLLFRIAHEQIVDEYESIDKRVNGLLKSTNLTADRINDFLFEIEHLENRLENLNKLLDSNELKVTIHPM